MDHPGFELLQGKDHFFLKVSRPAVGSTQPRIQWIIGTLPAVKSLGSETTPLSSA